MTETAQPGGLARRVVLRRAAGIGIGGVIAAVTVRASRADGGGQVVVDNFAFLPSTLQVKLGTTVTWTNHDDIPHSVVCPALNFHSHPMDTNESVSFTVTKAGLFTYVCGLHPFMHGQLAVTA